eukprot:SAG31_NODE_1211_length_9376_cov_2.931767_10_plen_162_part_00
MLPLVRSSLAAPPPRAPRPRGLVDPNVIYYLEEPPGPSVSNHPMMCGTAVEWYRIFLKNVQLCSHRTRGSFPTAPPRRRTAAVDVVIWDGDTTWYLAIRWLRRGPVYVRCLRSTLPNRKKYAPENLRTVPKTAIICRGVGEDREVYTYGLSKPILVPKLEL